MNSVSALDRELDILDVAVVLLEALHRFRELPECLREEHPQLVEGLRGPNAGHDVLTLCIEQELAREATLPRRRIAGECDSGCRPFAGIAEDHLDDVRRSAK